MKAKASKDEESKVRNFEKLNDIEQERANLPLRTPELRRIGNEALREILLCILATLFQS